MFSLAKAKKLGMAGSIFMLFLNYFPIISIPLASMFSISEENKTMLVRTLQVFLSLVGLILILIAVKYISDTLVDKSIFNNMLIAVILNGTGGIALSMLPLGISFVIAPIVSVISAIFLKRSYDRIAPKLHVKMFSIAALLYLIGSLLALITILLSISLYSSYEGISIFFGALAGISITIIPFGFLILQAIAFFLIPQETSYHSQA